MLKFQNDYTTLFAAFEDFISVNDDVTIYPSTAVVGKICLENSYVIGANSFVNKTVGQGATVVGAPAKRIK